MKIVATCFETQVPKATNLKTAGYWLWCELYIPQAGIEPKGMALTGIALTLEKTRKEANKKQASKKG